MDICIELFRRSIPQLKPNKRRYVMLELEKLLPTEKYFLESMLIKFALQGKVPARLVNGIDLNETMDEENQIKKESNPECLVVVEQQNSSAENIPDSGPETNTN